MVIPRILLVTRREERQAGMQGILVCGYVGVREMLGYRTCYIQCEAYLGVGHPDV